VTRRPPKPVLIAIVSVQLVSAVLAWRDLARRTDRQVRGKKKLWRILIVINPGNSFAYWAVGRR
jgi:hypothetical protein